MRRIKNHTTYKLEYIKKYIEAYLSATKKLKEKYYIDAFAGSGKCLLCNDKCKSSGGKRCYICGRGEVVNGSVFISLKCKNIFNKYLFIDKDKKCVEEIKKLILKDTDIGEEVKKRIEIKQGDSNLLLDDEFSKSIDYYTGCLILLDPEGPELSWNIIKSLSVIKKLDLLILYPYDMALVRMMNKKYKERINNFYGSTEWQIIRNKKISPQMKKEEILNLYIGSLRKIGFEYVVYRQIQRGYRTGKSLYHLILATHYNIGEKIMKDIFDKEIDGQKKFKFK